MAVVSFFRNFIVCAIVSLQCDCIALVVSLQHLFTSLTNAVKCGGGIVTDAPSGTAYCHQKREVN
eukprot:6480103-Amphidinium_carterae.2